MHQEASWVERHRTSPLPKDRSATAYSRVIASVAVGIQETVDQYLPCSPERIPQARIQILKLCAQRDLEHPYDLLICADQVMKSDKVSDEDRIASIVCGRVLLVRTSPDSHTSLLNR